MEGSRSWVEEREAGSRSWGVEVGGSLADPLRGRRGAEAEEEAAGGLLQVEAGRVWAESRVWGNLWPSREEEKEEEETLGQEAEEEGAPSEGEEEEEDEHPKKKKIKCQQHHRNYGNCRMPESTAHLGRS